jgi:hypothetical protein
MATTSFEGVMEREWGFCGRETFTACFSGLLRSWKCSVQSHDADIRSAGVEKSVIVIW